MQDKKKGIFKEFIENGKFIDYIKISEMECKLSLIITAIVVASLYYIDIFENFNLYIETFKNLSQNIGIALVTLLGIIFTGITLIISILNKKIIHEIDRINGEGTTNKLLVSFKFLVVNIGISIMLFFYIYIMIDVKSINPPKIVFYLILTLVVYYFNFLIFYTVSLILNTIRIYFIVNKYEEIVDGKRSIVDDANEIRIDFILNTILSNVSKEEFIESLNEYIDNSNIDNKENVKEYLNNYYS